MRFLLGLALATCLTLPTTASDTALLVTTSEGVNYVVLVGPNDQSRWFKEELGAENLKQLPIEPNDVELMSDDPQAAWDAGTAVPEARVIQHPDGDSTILWQNDHGDWEYRHSGGGGGQTGGNVTIDEMEQRLRRSGAVGGGGGSGSFGGAPGGGVKIICERCSEDEK